jgi:hypothetical protein
MLGALENGNWKMVIGNWQESPARLRSYRFPFSHFHFPYYLRPSAFICG